MALSRGDIVADDRGGAFVVWRLTRDWQTGGMSAAMLPLSCKPPHARAVPIAVIAGEARAEGASLWANPEIRRHAPADTLRAMGYARASDLDAIARAIEVEVRAASELAERRRRESTMRAARAARADREARSSGADAAA